MGNREIMILKAEKRTFHKDYLSKIKNCQVAPLQEFLAGGGDSDQQLAMLSVKREILQVHRARKGCVDLLGKK